MQFFTALRIYALFFLFCAAQWSADAGEIRQRAHAVPGDGVIRLGDVAVIEGEPSADATMLAELPLFAAPNDNKSATLSRQDLQQILILSDVDVRTWRIVGAETTIIARRPARTVSPPPAAPVAPVAKPEPLKKVEAKPAPHVAAKPIAAKPLVATVSAEEVIPAPPSVAAPIVDTPAVAVAEPAAPAKPMVQVVATHRALTRGDIVKQSDVQLIPTAEDKLSGRLFQKPEEVIGKEVIRSIPAGKPIELGQVQALRLVKKNDQVTIRAKAAGVTVTISGKALEDGALNDNVTVEPAESHSRIMARVTGERQLEVYAAGPHYPTGAVKPQLSEGNK